MPQINPELLERLENKLKLSRRRLYELFDKTGRANHLPRHLAAIVFASERGINTFRYASEEELAEIRNTTRGAPPPPAPTAYSAPRKSARKTATAKKPIKKRGTTVFVVHGRDLKKRDAIFTFLRTINLKPLEWTQAISLTKQAAPYVGTVLEKAFEHAAAVVVLLTPDDKGKCKQEFHKENDPPYEKIFSGQARANVLFEAGMAFGTNAKSTVIVQVGEVRPFSDIWGRHVVHLKDTSASRKELADRLIIAGCDMDLTGQDWMTAGDFS
jgi:predicted nucleotide-binding protein